jgi:hypothetical protein
VFFSFSVLPDSNKLLVCGSITSVLFNVVSSSQSQCGTFCCQKYTPSSQCAGGGPGLVGVWRPHPEIRLEVGQMLQITNVVQVVIPRALVPPIMNTKANKEFKI